VAPKTFSFWNTSDLLHIIDGLPDMHSYSYACWKVMVVSGQQHVSEEARDQEGNCA
jgi:hypothetical protein